MKLKYGWHVYCAPEGDVTDGGEGAGGDEVEEVGEEKPPEAKAPPKKDRAKVERKHSRSPWASRFGVEPEPESKLDPEVQALKSTLESKIAVIERVEKSLTEREAKEIDKVRLSALKQARPKVSDAQLLEWAPKVDPTTTAGSRALAKWVEANSNLFESPTLPAGTVPKQIDEIVKTAQRTKGVKSRLLSPDRVRARAKTTFGAD